MSVLKSDIYADYKRCSYNKKKCSYKKCRKMKLLFEASSSSTKGIAMVVVGNSWKGLLLVTPKAHFSNIRSRNFLHLCRSSSSSSSSSSSAVNHTKLQVKMAAAAASEECYTFGPYKINQKEVFYSTQLSYAMVNLRPLLPDVLVCPRREVKRFVDLTSDETSDLWLTAQKVGAVLEQHHKASSLTLAIQDGPQAGQTVPHVHIHILPRKGGDFEKNDEIYDALDEKEKELKQKLDLDKERKDRTYEEMAEEADEYRKLFFKG